MANRFVRSMFETHPYHVSDLGPDLVSKIFVRARKSREMVILAYLSMKHMEI